MFGGKGNVVGVAGGAIILALVSNGLDLFSRQPVLSINHNRLDYRDSGRSRTFYGCQNELIRVIT
ncbi:hypothetical protein GCM10020331_009520 [Ectobacillus funiculus]